VWGRTSKHYSTVEYYTFIIRWYYIFKKMLVRNYLYDEKSDKLMKFRKTNDINCFIN